MTKERPAKTPAGDARFETRLDRLREIVEELETGELPLERAVERYEEGVGVLKQCAETLARARARVEELSKDAEGSLRLNPAPDLDRAARGAERIDDRD